MKRCKKLWDKFISMENLELAAKKAVQSKKSKSKTKFFLKNKDRLLLELQKMLLDGTFNTSEYKIVKIFEPKERFIYILPLYPDHIVHHALINILGPIWQSTFIHDSYACIPGRGLHKASQTLMRFMRRNRYVLQCDIRKFYPSINHDVMLKIIKRKIADKRLLALLENIIKSGGDGKNLPIGNLTSQWMGNVYLNVLDHFVKEKLGCRDYIRYCDDFCLFGNDKVVLQKFKCDIMRFVADELKLNFSRGAVFPVARGVSFIGYRHFKKFILLRKYGAKKLRKCVLNIARFNDHGDFALGQLAAYHGWIKWCNSYNFFINLCNEVRQISPQMCDVIVKGLGNSDNFS